MEPAALIDHAKAILRSDKGKPKQIALRRAISASYYSVFHAFLRAAADDLIGTNRMARKSAAYRLVYRAFEHADLQRFCEHATKKQLPQRYVEVLRSETFDGTIRVAADRFVQLQKWRHVADYDPQFRLTKSDALLAIEYAITANAMCRNAPVDERRNFVLCMLVPPR